MGKDESKDVESIAKSIKKYISEGSNPTQLAIGGVSGWYVHSFMMCKR